MNPFVRHDVKYFNNKLFRKFLEEISSFQRAISRAPRSFYYQRLFRVFRVTANICPENFRVVFKFYHRRPRTLRKVLKTLKITTYNCAKVELCKQTETHKGRGGGRRILVPHVPSEVETSGNQ